MTREDKGLEYSETPPGKGNLEELLLAHYQQELGSQNKLLKHFLKNLLNHPREKTKLPTYSFCRKMFQNYCLQRKNQRGCSQQMYGKNMEVGQEILSK